MDDKVKFLKVTDPSGNHLVGEINEIESLMGGDIDSLEAGEKFEVEIVEMTRAEFEALPEFEG